MKPRPRFIVGEGGAGPMIDARGSDVVDVAEVLEGVGDEFRVVRVLLGRWCRAGDGGLC